MDRYDSLSPRLPWPQGSGYKQADSYLKNGSISRYLADALEVASSNSQGSENIESFIQDEHLFE